MIADWLGIQHSAERDGGALDIELVAVTTRIGRPVLQRSRFVRHELTGLNRTSQPLNTALEVAALEAVQIMFHLQTAPALAEQFEVEFIFEGLRPLTDQVFDQLQILLLGIGKVPRDRS